MPIDSVALVPPLELPEELWITIFVEHMRGDGGIMDRDLGSLRRACTMATVCRYFARRWPMFVRNIRIFQFDLHGTRIQWSDVWRFQSLSDLRIWHPRPYVSWLRLPIWPSLRKLSVFGPDNNQLDARMLQRMPGLTRLSCASVRQCQSTKKGLGVLAQYVPHLEKLEFVGCSPNSGFFFAGLEKLTKLRELTLWFIRKSQWFVNDRAAFEWLEETFQAHIRPHCTETLINVTLCAAFDGYEFLDAMRDDTGTFVVARR